MEDMIARRGKPREDTRMSRTSKRTVKERRRRRKRYGRDI
jgi:hypothetical protein